MIKIKSKKPDEVDSFIDLLQTGYGVEVWCMRGGVSKVLFRIAEEGLLLYDFCEGVGIACNSLGEIHIATSEQRKERGER